jgi:hypothetical protein
MAREFLHF